MGFSPIPTVLVPAAAPMVGSLYDLTDLNAVHDELSIKNGDTTNDPWLSRAIAQASTQIRLYVKRPFQIETISDQFPIEADIWPSRDRILQLSRWPLVGITTLVTTADTPSGSALPFASTTGVVAGQQVSGVAFAPNTQIQPIAVGTTAQSVVPGTVGLSAPILADIPAGTPVTFGLSAAQLRSNQTQYLLAAGAEFQIDADHGHLLRINPYTGWAIHWESWPVTVIYSAGYAQGTVGVPADVTDAVLRLVTERWHSRGRDPSLREREQPMVGRHVWWVGGAPKSGVLPLEIEGVLDQYRAPSIG